jgi:hypothetical protein
MTITFSIRKRRQKSISISFNQVQYIIRLAPTMYTSKFYSGNPDYKPNFAEKVIKTIFGI